MAVRRPFRRSRAEPPAAESPSSPAVAGNAEPTTPAPATTPQAPADPQERIDGLRAWVAQLHRKLAVRTYVGAAIAVLALAAAAVALVLTLDLNQDAATNGDVQSLQDQISAVEQSASQAAQQDVQALDRPLAELEDEVNRISTGQTTTKRELRVVQDDIKELRSQVSSARSSSGGGSQAGQASGQASSP